MHAREVRTVPRKRKKSSSKKNSKTNTKKRKLQHFSFLTSLKKSFKNAILQDSETNPLQPQISNLEDLTDRDSSVRGQLLIIKKKCKTGLQNDEFAENEKEKAVNLINKINSWLFELNGRILNYFAEENRRKLIKDKLYSDIRTFLSESTQFFFKKEQRKLFIAHICKDESLYLYYAGNIRLLGNLWYVLAKATPKFYEKASILYQMALGFDEKIPETDKKFRFSENEVRTLQTRIEKIKSRYEQPVNQTNEAEKSIETRQTTQTETPADSMNQVSQTAASTEPQTTTQSPIRNSGSFTSPSQTETPTDTVNQVSQTETSARPRIDTQSSIRNSGNFTFLSLPVTENIPSLATYLSFDTFYEAFTKK